MNIQHKEDENFSTFFIKENQKKVAEIGYSVRNEDRIIIHHTHVDSSLSGKGIGKQLVDKVVNLAREKGLKIIPVCSFAAKVMTAEAYKDVLA